MFSCSQPGFRRMVASWTAAAATAGHESIDKVDSSQIMEEQSNQAGLVVWSEDRGQFCKLHMWKVGCLFCLGALKSGRKWLWSELLRTPAADGAVTSQHSAPTSRSHRARSAVACAWPLFVSAYWLVKRNHSGVETKFVVYFVFLFHPLAECLIIECLGLRVLNTRSFLDFWKPFFNGSIHIKCIKMFTF